MAWNAYNAISISMNIYQLVIWEHDVKKPSVEAFMGRKKLKEMCKMLIFRVQFSASWLRPLKAAHSGCQVYYWVRRGSATLLNPDHCWLENCHWVSYEGKTVRVMPNKSGILDCTSWIGGWLNKYYQHTTTGRGEGTVETAFLPALLPRSLFHAADILFSFFVFSWGTLEGTFCSLRKWSDICLVRFQVWFIFAKIDVGALGCWRNPNWNN